MSVNVGAEMMRLFGVLRHEPTAKWVRAKLGGHFVVDSRAALLVWEPRRIVPTYAVPEQDFRAELVPVEPAPASEVPVLHPGIPFAVHSTAGQTYDVRVGDDVRGVLDYNALREIRPVHAQVVKPTTRERDTSRALTRQERDALIAYADKQALSETTSPSTRRKRQAVADLLAFMAGTGVRINEARSLRWEEVDLDAGVVTINGTKSKAALRCLTLPDWLITRLKLRADTVGTEGLVFSSPHHLNEPERRWDASNSAKAVSRAICASGFDWATPHTLRRTVATLLHEAGVPIARTADQLGHADPAMTASHYLGRDLMGDKSSVAEYL